MIAGLLALVATALAGPSTEPGTELVIVLDNSCSMIEPHSTKDQLQKPAADPDRRAVLGAQIVDALAAGDDRVQVLAFPLQERTGVLEVDGPAAIRDIGPASGTWFTGPLERARQILVGSSKRDRMLIVLSDGAPTDYDQPARGRELLGLDQDGRAFETLVLGLFPDEEPEAEGFLRALARFPEDYHRVDDGGAVVSHFTEGYARALGSKALTGTLSSGGSTSFDVGRYVTEVLAVTTTVDRSGPYSAELKRGGRTVPVQAAGDNGCTHGTRKNPALCNPPRMHFQTWRASHDPARPSSWSLTVPRAGGDVAYGVILRYDLFAEVDATEPAKVDTPAKIRARLTWNGETFDDAEFFGKDGFTAEAIANGERVPLTHVGAGVFEGDYTPRSSRPVPVVVRFSNTWMQKLGQGTLSVVKPPPLELAGTEVLDFGSWRGGRWATTSCQALTLVGNHGFDHATVQFDFRGLPAGSSLELAPNGQGWQVCARAKGCCGTLDTDATTALVARATDAEGSTAERTVRVVFHVDRTGFLKCWWPWICALLTLLVVFWFLYGWIRPHDFDEELTVRIAGSERQLSRSAALVLREQPRGRRGFYRNARVSLTHAGDFVAKTRGAAFWIEATGSGETTIHLQGPLEVMDRRTKQWKPLTPEEAADGLRTNIVYRLGDVYYRFQ
ncbi:MAG: VWA domain-containing protein [Alphaproteobacteria bacterium]|nr:VWA domain-containing protein [Alphaproteobacteria bacterium]MCB9690592.1 VWA domain-containing protein [Alphaproteobacteria bacterium]